jgi:hypothetical protein
MPKFTTKKRIKVIFIIFILLFCSVWIGQNIPEQISSQKGEPRKAIFQQENIRDESGNVLTEFPKTVAYLEINGVRYEGKVKEKESIYDFMDRLRKEGKINFKDKNYMVLGSFVEEINGIRGNGEKNWIYYVNGKEAEIGISKYEIGPGDVVTWKYEKNY